MLDNEPLVQEEIERAFGEFEAEAPRRADDPCRARRRACDCACFP